MSLRCFSSDHQSQFFIPPSDPIIFPSTSATKTIPSSKANFIVLYNFSGLTGNSAKLKIKLGHVFSGDIERKDKFFERLGLTKAGSLFVEI